MACKRKYIRPHYALQSFLGLGDTIVCPRSARGAHILYMLFRGIFSGQAGLESTLLCQTAFDAKQPGHLFQGSTAGLNCSKISTLLSGFGIYEPKAYRAKKNATTQIPV